MADDGAPTYENGTSRVWFLQTAESSAGEVHERRVEQGGHLRIPRGTPHRARNASKEYPALVRWQTRPALRTTSFCRTVAWLGDDPRLLDTALLAHEFRDVLRPTGVKGALVPVVGRIAVQAGRRLQER